MTELHRKILAFFLTLSIILLLTVPAFPAQEKGKKPQDPAASLREGNDIYYAVKSGDTLIGYSVYKVERKMQLAGESFIKFQSLSRLKAGMGYIEDSLFQMDFSVASQELSPAYMLLKQTTPQTDLLSEVIFSKGLIAQKNVVGKEASSSIIPVDSACFLFVNNLWGRLDTFVEHYLLLILIARQGTTKIRVYDPVLRTSGDIQVIPSREEKIDHNGTGITCRIYTINDFYGIPLMTVWFDQSSGRIIRMKEVGGTLTFELSNRSVVQEFKKVKGVDLWATHIVPSPLYFPDPRSVESLTLEAKFFGRGITCTSHKVIGFEQIFTGEATELSAAGRFEVKTSKPVVDKPNPFPPRAIPPDLAPYLKAEPGIETDNEYIKNKAMEVTWKSKDSFTAASRLCKWIKDNIKVGTSMPSALFSFLNGIGNSESRSMLLVAMCRTLGIPAKKVGGMAFKDGDFVPSNWVEVYLENNGWLPFDPETGEGTIDATRICLWEFGDITTGEITSLDFAPRPPRTVSYYQKDLSWPVGEERIFSIKKGENIIGEEKAAIEDIIFQEGRETYIFTSTSTLTIGDNTFKAEGKLHMTPNVLPLEYQMESGMGGSLVTQHFRFGKDTISQVFKVADTEKTRDIPYSKGTYLIDQRFLSQWALVVGQIPKLQIGKKYIFTAFVPEDLGTREIELEVKNYERIEAGGKEVNAFRCESKKGMVFYIDPNGNVVKIALPPQELEFTLVKSEFKLKK
ncbi:MAG: transglutaminase-like domain-containing protein [Candidatus Eremiobacteraeota bacterium]|nr:transglutaminase-like domain-containing protein [Candidatus Eremiobacteraeota bacterium]